MSSVVLLKAQLLGHGRDAACDVLAWQNEPGSEFAYRQFRVIDAPGDLPDGDYTITFEGRSYSTRKQQGQWAMQKVS